MVVGMLQRYMQVNVCVSSQSNYKYDLVSRYGVCNWSVQCAHKYVCDAGNV